MATAKLCPCSQEEEREPVTGLLCEKKPNLDGSRTVIQRFSDDLFPCCDAATHQRHDGFIWCQLCNLWVAPRSKCAGLTGYELEQAATRQKLLNAEIAVAQRLTSLGFTLQDDSLLPAACFCCGRFVQSRVPCDKHKRELVVIVHHEVCEDCEQQLQEKKTGGGKRKRSSEEEKEEKEMGCCSSFVSVVSLEGATGIKLETREATEDEKKKGRAAAAPWSRGVVATLKK